MKRIFAILLLILILPLSFSSCAKERGTELYTVSTEGVTITVRGSGESASQLTVYRGASRILLENVDVSRSVGNLFGTYGLSLQDLNFDGYTDILLADAKEDDIVSYQVFLFDEDSLTYEWCETLSGLCNLEANEDLSATLAFSHSVTWFGDIGDEANFSVTTESSTKYVWQDGAFLPSIQISLSKYSNADKRPYNLAVSYYDEDLEQLVEDTDDWLSEADLQLTDLTALYYFR